MGICMFLVHGGQPLQFVTHPCARGGAVDFQVNGDPPRSEGVTPMGADPCIYIVCFLIYNKAQAYEPRPIDLSH